jgi:hypothetical protein
MQIFRIRVPQQYTPPEGHEGFQPERMHVQVGVARAGMR